MEPVKTYTGATEDELWQQIKADLNENTLEFNAVIEQGSQKVSLDIDIDLGGGFESGYSTTTFYAPLPEQHDFKFAVHAEHFTDEIGKFFGMQDIDTGYPELDHHLVIKTNDETRIKPLFEDATVRAVFETLTDFDFGIHNHKIEDTDAEQPYLELNIDDGITDGAVLQKIYSAFYKVLLIVKGF